MSYWDLIILSLSCKQLYSSLTLHDEKKKKNNFSRPFSFEITTFSAYRYRLDLIESYYKQQL